MRGQAQVIVGCQVNHLPAVESADWRLLILKNSEAEVSALGFEIVQLFGQVAKRIDAGSGSGHFSSQFWTRQLVAANQTSSSLIPEWPEKVFRGKHGLKKAVL